MSLSHTASEIFRIK